VSEKGVFRYLLEMCHERQLNCSTQPSKANKQSKQASKQASKPANWLGLAL
jgi:hypothetical protein